MKRLVIVLIAVATLLVAGGIVLLATWTIPAPSGQVEKVIPSDRFPR